MHFWDQVKLRLVEVSGHYKGMGDGFQGHRVSVLKVCERLFAGKNQQKICFRVSREWFLFIGTASFQPAMSPLRMGFTGDCR